MKSAYKILASIGMIALSTAVGLGVRHVVAVRKRRKGQDGCDAPENTDVVAQAADEDSESEDAEASENSADDASDDADDADDSANDAEDAAADDDADEDSDDADDGEEDDGEIPPISEDGELIEAETEIHPDAIAAGSEDVAAHSDGEEA